MLTRTAPYQITWEKLPDDFVLDDEPVDNINQPPLAAALTESLQLAGRLSANALTFTNYGICATVNDKIVVKAPDWGYVPTIGVSRAEVRRSYTPQLQGEIPVIVMEFISDTEGSEYSTKPTYPPGKWFFYEQVLCVPNYAIFAPETGVLEVYQLDSSGQYQVRQADVNNRYWIAEMGLFLGIWQGSRENRTGFWLRWWDEQGDLLLWGFELAEQERQRTEQERQRAEQERQRADRLAAQLRAAGIEPEV
ncbi:Uma2 family endonuclease [Planktothrix sp. FACHB-1355]|uniref:Uma2 family endonuclease n=1 Tax=Aerosakkonema funiforme FACHB-1375 TaxID=2949571 RepID=A0A926VCS5_9CYAN|nr:MULTISPECIES: Uma2 family endonuclease [Oscillatoriales]MBD2180993.1 Uma2 family endonuclease [Aerosakkonema funiforme FACHB-1375]MBD3561204.1 Uma2 family endonuclease [Planktothrix sp. FACHB-1355]